MSVGNDMGSPETTQMLSPPPGSFVDREELVKHVTEFAVSQGYVVIITHSRKDKYVSLGCDRGGHHRNRQKPVDESSSAPTRKRKAGSRATNCPFKCVGKKDDDLWVLSVRNGEHNHEPLKDLSEHPSAGRFTETEVMLIKEMTEAGLKPRQILKRLKQNNPGLLSTPKHVYNVKSKLRQGNVAVRRSNTLRPQSSSVGNLDIPTSSEPSWTPHYLPQRVPNFIGNRFIDSQSSASIDVINPATQQVVSQVPLTTHEELGTAVFAAKRALPSWRNTPVTDRQRIMFKFQELIRRDIDKLVLNITTEHGKPLKDAYSEVLHGLEVLELACGTASLQMGEFSSNVSHGIDSYSIRDPVGVCAGICPFNFPALVPLLMFPVAVTCGNTFILKPSEKVPRASIMLAELAVEAGLPNGVLNIVHGTDQDVISALCDNEDIRAISLVCSDSAMRYVDGRASVSCKRLQSVMGAKNHAIIMPDASLDATLSTLVAAGFGAAGLRPAAISAVIFVGGLDLWEDKLVERAKLIKINAGTETDADLGPVISQEAKEQTCRLIQSGIDSGARLALDGREIMVEGYELGNFVGPTILSGIREDMECYREEIFGPVLLCLEADSLEEAINIVNRSRTVGGASIFTNSGSAARKFQTEIEASLVGVNVPVAAPLPVFSVTSTGVSFAGDLNNFHGKAGVHFYTKVKTVTQQWKDFSSTSGFSRSNGEFMLDGEFSGNGQESLGNLETFAN